MQKLRSKTKKKILLLLLAGLVIGLSKSRGTTRRILRAIPKELEKIDREYLYRALREFKTRRLIEYKEQLDGIISVTLSRNGERIAMRYSLDTLVIPTPQKWDKKWRLVIFDIPEKKRAGRNALRDKLRDCGFKEWQHSVFVYPYPCENEIDFIIEVFDLRPYVRYAEVTYLTNEAELRLSFNLIH